MQATADQSKAIETKPGSKPKPESKDDLKSLPMPEVEEKIGIVSEGLEPSRSGETPGAIWSE